jgi:hypothetical protein
MQSTATRPAKCFVDALHDNDSFVHARHAGGEGLPALSHWPDGA